MEVLEGRGTVVHRASQQLALASSTNGVRLPSSPALTAQDRDHAIAAYLRAAESNPPVAWTGSQAVHREHAPAYFQYPAMMSPAVQRDLLRLIVGVAPHSVSVLDPFCGSGTVLTEAMFAGLECWASDLNPLAVLICQVKAGRYAPETLTGQLKRLLTWAKSDRSRAIETDLANWRKWFRRAAAEQLSKLRRSIRRVRSIDSRRFFWACLAETVRTTSNSRTSTYKLHIRPKGEISALDLPIEVFAEVAEKNIEKHLATAEHLRELKLLKDERYAGAVTVKRMNAAAGFPSAFDVLMTSPPYGDNVSTVPYGQSAYLPLQWIDLSDVDAAAARETLLSSTHEIDRRSLGGARPRWDRVDELKPLRDRSPLLDSVLRKLARKPHDRTTRVLGFFRDLDEVLPKLVAAVKVDGYLVWTVGNRRVGGQEIPMSGILAELLNDRSAVFVGSCRRRIPQKRMAYRNSISATMKEEHLLVFRRVAAKSVEHHG